LYIIFGASPIVSHINNNLAQMAAKHFLQTLNGVSLNENKNIQRPNTKALAIEKRHFPPTLSFSRN
jgi:hypothetical protein